MSVPFVEVSSHDYSTLEGRAHAIQEAASAAFVAMYNEGDLTWLPVDMSLRTSIPDDVARSSQWLAVADAFPSIAWRKYPLIGTRIWQNGVPLAPAEPGRTRWFVHTIWKPKPASRERSDHAYQENKAVFVRAREILATIRPRATKVAEPALERDPQETASPPLFDPFPTVSRERDAPHVTVVESVPASAAEGAAQPFTPPATLAPPNAELDAPTALPVLPAIPPDEEPGGDALSAAPHDATPPPPPRHLDVADTTIVASSSRYVAVSQVQGTLRSGSKKAAAVRKLAIDQVIEWLRGRKGVAVPADWRDRSSWEVGTDTGAMQCWWETDGSHVAMRLDEPCAQLPGRHWRVEFVLALTAKEVVVGTRLSVLVQRGVEPLVKPSIPGLVRLINSKLEFLADGAPGNGLAKFVASEADVRQLAGLISDRHRTIALIIVHTVAARSRAAISAATLAKRVAGIARVVMIDTGGAQRLAQALGPAGVIPRNGVRLYGRQFDADLASASCPVLPPESWPRRDAVGQLEDACAVVSVSVDDAEIDVPSFAHIRQLIARERRRQERERLTSASEEVVDEIASLRAALAAAEGDVAAAEELAAEQQNRAEETEEQLRSALAKLMIASERIDQLQASQRATVNDVPLPETWAALERWTVEQFQDRVVLTAGAMRAARASVFENIPLVAETIALLGNQYWTVKTTGSEEARLDLVEAQKKLYVEISPAGEALNNAKLKGQYQTTYQGSRYTLDQHVSGSSSRDRRRGFRLYFTWSDDLQKVIIGSLPEHLDNTLT